jgi:hypothetical protein
VSVLHAAPAAQSTGPAHGNAHFWNCTLQRPSPHEASLVQGSANALGVAIAPAGAAPAGAAAGLVTTGAGVAAVTAGCGCASVGAGATYGCGAVGGGSLSLAQALTIEPTPTRAMRDLRSIGAFLFPRRIGRLSKGFRVRARPLFILAASSARRF